MIDPNPLHSSLEVDHVFAQFLAQEEPSGAGMEALCRERPMLAKELRALYADWRRVDRFLNDIRLATPSTSARIRRLYGGGVDPAITLPGDREGDTSFSKQVLERLSYRSGAYGRYTVKGEINHGGQGAILRVWDEDLRRHLAMKVILGGAPEKEGGTPVISERNLGRFLEEAQITAQLDHPGIVAVHELGVDDLGGVYFTMKLVKGRDLKEIFALIHSGEQGWTTTRAVRVLLKVSEAMAYAHSKGAIHRDLKPGNVMVGRFGEAYVMDWGLARILGREDPRDLRIRSGSGEQSVFNTDRGDHTPATPESPLVTMDGDVIGTPSYMAPEQAAGFLTKVAERSDVYSLGAMLYHVLTGQVPYVVTGGDNSPREVLARLLVSAPTPIAELAPDAPADLVAICEKAMARDLDLRYAGAQELADDIEAFLDRRPVAAQEPNLGHALRLALQRNRAVAGTAAVALLVLLVSAIVFVIGLNDAADREARAARESLERGDIMAAGALRSQLDELYPVIPAKAASMHAWLGDLDDLTAREGRYRALVSEAGPATAKRAAALSAMLVQLADLKEQRPVVVARLRAAESLQERTVDSQDDLWRRVSEDLAEMDAFAGFELEPRVGLMPLRKDPGSGLWEFWFVESGERPEIDAEGQLSIGVDTGIVLVLLPGGSFEMGSSESEPGRAPNEKRHAVTLEPFFIGKFEVTQGQWEHVMNANLARYQDDEEAYTDAHPMESVTWFDCTEFANKLGLALLTEEQWEYACRAGSGTAFSAGATVANLQGRANLCDQSYPDSPYAKVAWADGHRYHAPVGSFAPNEFGLHDMHGNVSEWCANPYYDYAEGMPEEDDEIDLTEVRIFRGGDCWQDAVYTRSAFRNWDVPRSLKQARGFRVALTPE